MGVLRAQHARLVFGNIVPPLPYYPAIQLPVFVACVPRPCRQPQSAGAQEDELS